MTQIPLIYRYRIERRPEGYRFRFPDLREAETASGRPRISLPGRS